MTFLHRLTAVKHELISRIEATATIENEPYMTLTVETIGPGRAACLLSPSVTTANKTAT